MSPRLGGGGSESSGYGYIVPDRMGTLGCLVYDFLFLIVLNLVFVILRMEPDALFKLSKVTFFP